MDIYSFLDTHFVLIYKSHLYFTLKKYGLHFSHFLRKVVNVINISILCVNTTKLSFVCIWNKFDFSYFMTS